MATSVKSEDGVPGAQKFVPPDAKDFVTLREASSDCRGCDLYEDATQTVFGKGSRDAQVVMVGEQPGDIEDRRGEPFVGPAGGLLRRAAEDAGLDEDQLYITNAVKHFKFRSTGTGKRRLHKTPNRAEIVACRPWLVAEFTLLQQEVVVVLGATAAKALLGPSFRVTRERGKLLPWPESAQEPDDFPLASGLILATVHPSAALRADDREEVYEGLVADLRVVAESLTEA